jgi:hypothetical protein
MILSARSNIGNKVRNTNLPKTKPLMPLFEVISNSIHAINEARKVDQVKDTGEIKIRIIRQGSEETLIGLENIDEYPVKSFEVTDNGIGLNDDNLNFFIETDTDHKIEIGGKGVGRFICLKAFGQMKVESTFGNGNGKIFREFDFKATKEGFHNFNEEKPAGEGRRLGTKITLIDYKEIYQKNVPRPMMEIGREIVYHFQLYFIQDTAPKIVLENQNNVFVDLKTIFNTEFKTEILNKEFEVAGFSLNLYLTKSEKAQSHRLYYCAHNRAVKSEGLSSRIVDLGKYSIKSDDGNFYYQAFVVGKVLDEHVDQERIGFNFPSEEPDDDEDKEKDTLFDEITLSKVRKGAMQAIEDLLQDYLDEVRQKKIDNYKPIILDELPQYKSVFEHRQEDIRKLQPNLPKNKLDIELYKIEVDWKLEVKEEGARLLEEKKDVTNLDQYKARYEKFLSDFNDIGKTDLARYIVHRKSIIELLEYLLNPVNQDKFSDEDLIHSLFFPIRSTSDNIPHDKQNLWLLDERLTYHSYLASDKKFKSVSHIQLRSGDRADLLIYNDALVFSETEKAPFPSFTIVEFKKPQRDNYEDYSEKENPIEQSEKYIEQLLTGKVKDRNNRFISVDPRIPFYIYVICDVTPSLETILKRREFDRTPDGNGWFLFKTKHYNAYFEVLPFEKVLLDAKKRNRILFDKLGLSSH